MSSSSSYSNSNSNPQAGVGVHDVFLSFRGEDTRSGFTNYLYDALTREGIKTFFDDDNLARGKAISEGLMKAIQGSRSSVVVLSENYAFSSWCLTELCKIVECMDTSGLIVLPIFYHVNPSHVRKLIGSYRDAFKKHENNPRLDFEEVEAWRDALKKVGNLAGWTLEDRDVEAKFIKDFVAKISSLLDIRKESPHEVYFDQSLVSKMVNPANAPSLVGKFLDDERSEDFIKDYILPIRSALPVEELVKECEKRNRLVLLSQFLEQLVNEGSQDVHVHNALGKIIINSNNNPEHFLTTNLCYDSRVVGKHCEIQDHPTLAVVAYRRGQCDDELINVTNKNSLFTLQARYVVERMDGKLWEKVLDPKNEYRRQLIDQVVSTALPESKSPDEVSAAIKAFNRFDCFEGPEIAKVAVNVQLYEEAFSMYKKLNLNVEAVNVLLDNIQSIDRAVEFAYRIEEVDVWKQVRKAQRAAGDVSVHHNHHLVNEPVDFDRSLERKRDQPVSETRHYRNPNNNPQVPNTRGSKALAILKTHFQDRIGPNKSLFVVVFESKISSWFTTRSSKQSVSVPVERKWYRGWNLRGLAVCVCFRPYSSNTLSCKMRYGMNKIQIGGHRCQPECGKSNSFYHIWMIYFPFDEPRKQLIPVVCSEIEITFHNELLDDDWCFGQCGIRLVYKKDIKELNQINESPNVRDIEAYLIPNFIQNELPIPDDRLKRLSHPHSSKMLDPGDDYDDSDEESEDWHEGVDDLDMGLKVLKEHFQDRSGPMKSLDAVVFGSKIPSWFTISSSEPSSTELKGDWWGSNLMGLAVCVCFRLQRSNTIYCGMRFDKSIIQIGEHKYCQPSCGKSNTFRIWMIYLPRSDLPDQFFKMGSGQIVISFQNGLQSNDENSFNGVRFVYEKDIKELNQIN